MAIKIKLIFTREDIHEWLVKPEGYLSSIFRSGETYIKLETVLVTFLKENNMMNENE